jgi:hypothetical protein
MSLLLRRGAAGGPPNIVVTLITAAASVFSAQAPAVSASVIVAPRSASGAHGSGTPQVAAGVIIIPQSASGSYGSGTPQIAANIILTLLTGSAGHGAGIPVIAVGGAPPAPTGVARKLYIDQDAGYFVVSPTNRRRLGPMIWKNQDNYLLEIYLLRQTGVYGRPFLFDNRSTATVLVDIGPI